MVNHTPATSFAISPSPILINLKNSIPGNSLVAMAATFPIFHGALALALMMTIDQLRIVCVPGQILWWRSEGASNVTIEAAFDRRVGLN